jgi:sugar lactone lactonase YvrE
VRRSSSRYFLDVVLAIVATALALVIVVVLLIVNAGSIAHPFINSPGRVVTFAGVPYSWCPKSDNATGSVVVCQPGGLAFDSRRGYLYVADTGGNAIRRVDNAGIVSTFGGGWSSRMHADRYDCSDVDGRRSVAHVCHPTDVAYEETSDRLYFTDDGGLRVIASDGEVSTIVASSKSRDCELRGAAQPSDTNCLPTSLTIDPKDQSIWVTHGRAILRIDRNRKVTVEAGDCSAVDPDSQTDGVGQSACLAEPHGIRFDNFDQTLYFADGQLIRTIDRAGRVITIAGWQYPPSFDLATDTGATWCRYWDGPRVFAVFCGPEFPTADDNGNIFVADSGNEAIRKIDRNGIVSTVAGHYYVFGTFHAPTCKGIDGSGFGAKFCSPTGIAIDNRRKLLFVSDSRARQIREVLLAPVN